MTRGQLPQQFVGTQGHDKSQQKQNGPDVGHREHRTGKPPSAKFRCFKTACVLQGHEHADKANDGQRKLLRSGFLHSMASTMGDSTRSNSLKRATDCAKISQSVSEYSLVFTTQAGN